MAREFPVNSPRHPADVRCSRMRADRSFGRSPALVPPKNRTTPMAAKKKAKKAAKKAGKKAGKKK